MQQKKNRRGREYLNDFRRDVNGSYLYQGSYRRYTGSMPYAKLRGLLWALCGGALAALAAAGMVPAPGAMQQFYVLLPYAGALVAGISAVWALARMSRGGARLRSYVYEETVAKLPLRCLLTGGFGRAGCSRGVYGCVLERRTKRYPVCSIICSTGRCGCCGCFCRGAHHPGGGLYRRIRLRARKVKDLAP